MRGRAERAFSLYKASLAWKLHNASVFDAWSYNFNTNMKFSTFLGECFKRGTPHNDAYQAAVALSNVGINEDEYKDFIVVSCGRHYDDFDLLKDKITAYNEWVHREPPRSLSEDDLKVVNGLPQIMNDNSLSDLDKAEIITIAGVWLDLWKLKDECNFMFEVHWSKIHKYRGLYEKH